MQTEYNEESVYRTADRALGSLNLMTYTDDGIEQAQDVLEQAVDESDVSAAYESLEHAYQRLSRQEQEMHGTQLEAPWDVFHLRGAVVTIERELQ